MNCLKYRVVNKDRQLSSLIAVALFIVTQFLSMYCGMEFIASLASTSALETIKDSDDIPLPEIVVLNPFLKAKRDPVELSTTVKLNQDSLHLSSLPKFAHGYNYHLSNYVPLMRLPHEGVVKDNNLWLINRVLLI